MRKVSDEEELAMAENGTFSSGELSAVLRSNALVSSFMVWLLFTLSGVLNLADNIYLSAHPGAYDPARFLRIHQLTLVATAVFAVLAIIHMLRLHAYTRSKHKHITPDMMDWPVLVGESDEEVGRRLRWMLAHNEKYAGLKIDGPATTSLFCSVITMLVVLFRSQDKPRVRILLPDRGTFPAKATIVEVSEGHVDDPRCYIPRCRSYYCTESQIAESVMRRFDFVEDKVFLRRVADLVSKHPCNIGTCIEDAPTDAERADTKK